jgi:hypothetical protein
MFAIARKFLAADSFRQFSSRVQVLPSFNRKLLAVSRVVCSVRKAHFHVISR